MGGTLEEDTLSGFAKPQAAFPRIVSLLMKRSDEPALFERAPRLPDGFRYQSDFLSPNDEQDLVGRLQTLPFQGFEFHGFLGKRRVVSFGWKYDFNDRRLQKADDMPPFLLPLRERAAEWAGLDASSFQHVLVT